MKKKIDDNEKVDLDKKNNHKKMRRGKNISYDNLFNCKLVKIHLLKGDQIKINNQELEKKLQISINKN